MRILDRKPRDNFNEYVVVDRGHCNDRRFVSATVNEISLRHNEWFWGHYFTNYDAAKAHFDSR